MRVKYSCYKSLLYLLLVNTPNNMENNNFYHKLEYKSIFCYTFCDKKIEYTNMLKDSKHSFVTLHPQWHLSLHLHLSAWPVPLLLL
jgi:hypothetical protein